MKLHESKTVKKPFLHPLSGAVILAVDNLFFGANAILGGVATPVVSVLAFLMTSIGVYWVQKNKQNETKLKSLRKALFSGMIAGIPTSIGGTVLGTLVLLFSGQSTAEKEKK